MVNMQTDFQKLRKAIYETKMHHLKHIGVASVLLAISVLLNSIIKLPLDGLCLLVTTLSSGLVLIQIQLISMRLDGLNSSVSRLHLMNETDELKPHIIKIRKRLKYCRLTDVERKRIIVCLDYILACSKYQNIHLY